MAFNIEDIQIGDTVIAYDEIQKDTILSRVTNTFAKSWQKMVRIVAGGDTITATNNHPFYLPQLGKYLRADSLRQNMKLLALTGALLTVQSTFAFDTTVQVFNLEVEEHHNYFVGDAGVLVHNDRCYLNDAGLKNTPKPGSDHSQINLIAEAFPENIATQDEVARNLNLELKRLAEQEQPDPSLEDYLKAGYDGYDIPDPIRELRKDRVRAWEVMYVNGLDMNIPTLSKLAEDIGEFPSLPQFLKDYPDHFDSWNSIESLTSANRGNPITIQEVKRLQDDLTIWNTSNNWAVRTTTVYYHLKGFVKGSRRVGGHLLSEIDDAAGWGSHLRVVENSGLSEFDDAVTSIVDIPKSSLQKNSQGVAKIDALTGQELFIAKYASQNNQPNFDEILRYVRKDLPDGQTLFPEDWSYQMIIEQIASARANPNITTWPSANGNGVEALSESGVTIRWFEFSDQLPSTYFPKF